MFRSILLSAVVVLSVAAPVFSRQPPVSGPAPDGQSRATCLRQVESLHIARVKRGVSRQSSLALRDRQRRQCR
jgi:hypothetical protein